MYMCTICVTICDSFLACYAQTRSFLRCNIIIISLFHQCNDSFLRCFDNNISGSGADDFPAGVEFRESAWVSCSLSKPPLLCTFVSHRSDDLSALIFPPSVITA